MLSFNRFQRRYAPSDSVMPMSPHWVEAKGCLIVIDEERKNRIFLAATIMTFVTFVVQFVLGVICFRALWISRRRSKSNLTICLILHTAFLEVVNIVGLVTSIISFYLVVTMPRISGLEYCDEYYIIARKIHDINSVSNVAFAISGSLTDAMLIFRCRQIWKFTLHSRPDLIVLVPTILFVGSLACLGRAYMGSLIYNVWTLAYCSVTLVLNLTLTSLIVWRLWQCKVQLQKALGVGHGKHYSVLTTVFIESAFLNVVCSILLLASSAVNPHREEYGYLWENDTMYWLFDVWAAITPAIQACSNYLIIYRGAQNAYGSWSNNITTMNQSTAIFAAPCSPVSGDNEEMEMNDSNEKEVA